MIPIDGQPVLTAAAMRAAEQAAIDARETVDSLMQRAGRGVADAVRRLAPGSDVLILCGPGNNGGDGYVAAALLATHGHDVRVAAIAAPTSAAARAARATWTGPVGEIALANPAPVLIDALFGTGLSRPLGDDLVEALHRLRAAARLAIAVDLPSGVATDDGALLSPVPAFDLTLALGALKPAHLLQPAAGRMGNVRLLDIGVPFASDTCALVAPIVAAPGAEAHKYSRGMVAVIAGRMPGAAALAATAAAHAGAGYVLLIGSATDRLPHAIVRRSWRDDALDDARIGAVVIGPGLGRADPVRLDAALASAHPLVIDGDALHLLDPARLAGRSAPAILTPHAGEFAALFGTGAGSKIDRTRDAARAIGATIVFKGADTVIAAPDGRVRIAPVASSWLSTAGTGDVLAGAIAARVAAGDDPLDAAASGVWLHGEAARRLGPAFLADDLAAALSRAWPAR